MSTTKQFSIQRCDEEGCREFQDEVVVEYNLTIYLNNRYFISLLCSPQHLEELVYGYLFSEGVIGRREDILHLDLDEKNGKAMVQIDREDLFTFAGDQLMGETTVTTACGKGRKVSFPVVRDGSDEKIVPLPVAAGDVVRLIRQFNKSSDLFLRTGGVHSCALCTNTDILYARDDIGRHNALEKLLGRAMLEGIDLKDKVVLTTGRMSSEIVDKVILRSIPVLISRSAPTDKAIDLARKVGLKLIGFVRGNRMNVYTE